MIITHCSEDDFELDAGDNQQLQTAVRQLEKLTLGQCPSTAHSLAVPRETKKCQLAKHLSGLRYVNWFASVRQQHLAMLDDEEVLSFRALSA